MTGPPWRPHLPSQRASSLSNSAPVFKPQTIQEIDLHALYSATYKKFLSRDMTCPKLMACHCHSGLELLFSNPASASSSVARNGTLSLIPDASLASPLHSEDHGILRRPAPPTSTVWTHLFCRAHRTARGRVLSPHSLGVPGVRGLCHSRVCPLCPAGGQTKSGTQSMFVE